MTEATWPRALQRVEGPPPEAQIGGVVEAMGGPRADDQEAHGPGELPARAFEAGRVPRATVTRVAPERIALGDEVALEAGRMAMQRSLVIPGPP